MTKMYLEGNLTAKNLQESFLDQTAMRYFLLPFKSELSGRSEKCTCEEFVRFWDTYSPIFKPCYPSADELGVVNWDQPLCKMVDQLKTAFKTHLAFHFPKRFQKYMLALIKQRFDLKDSSQKVDGVDRHTLVNNDITIYTKKLVKLIQNGFNESDPEESEEIENSRIPDDVVKQVQDERTFIGLKAKDSLFKLEKSRNLTTEMIITHVKMSLFFESNNIKSFSLFPVSEIDRTFCYIDQKVLDSLFQKNRIRGEKTLKVAFKLTNKLWRKTGIAVRKKVKRCPRSRKARKRYGIGQLPKGCIVKSILTDGVAICVNAYYDDVNTNVSLENLPEEYHIIASDDGRVNLHLVLL